jgi:NTP pyrophosphohydrolases including oxidative damage repair enzymes
MQQHEVTQIDGGLPYRNSVGVCLINAKGQVFCAERRDKKGAWQFPQGGIQKGEDPALAIFREMKEEIGTDKGVLIGKVPERLRYEFPDYLQYKNGVFRGKYRGQEQIWFAMLFQGQDSDIDLSGADEPEAPEFINWRWVELSETIELIVPFKRPVYEVVAQTFQPLVDAIRRGETPAALG